MDLRKELMFRAMLAKDAKRFNEVMDAMNHVAMFDMVLTVEERKLLSLGYKDVTTAKRASRKALIAIEMKEEEKGSESHVKMAIEFRHKVEAELDKLCCIVIDIVDKHLLPYSSDAGSTVFYYRMKGDYYRYLAEFKMEPEYSGVVDESLKAYENALNIAMANLSPAHPIRLGLTLNISVFYNEILELPDRAHQIAKQAFDDAIPDLDLINEDLYDRSILMLQSLDTNLDFCHSVSFMDSDTESTQEYTENSGAPGVSNVDLDAESKSKRKSEASGDSAVDGDAN